MARKFRTKAATKTAAKSVRPEAQVAKQASPAYPEQAFPAIVGIDAFAGGLEAFTQLLGALPIDTGMAFVLVQHLEPKHESVLTRLLARATKMPVQEVHKGHVEPNHVYVIPTNADMSQLDGLLIQVGLIIRDVTSYKVLTVGQSTVVSLQDFLGVLAAAAEGSGDTQLTPESQLFPLKRFLAAFHEAVKLMQSLLWERDIKRSKLTRREVQILKHIAGGKTSKEIARSLGVSLKTVAAHRSNIMEKLDMHDVASLVRYAIRQGLILP